MLKRVFKVIKRSILALMFLALSLPKITVGVSVYAMENLNMYKSVLAQYYEAVTGFGRENFFNDFTDGSSYHSVGNAIGKDINMNMLPYLPAPEQMNFNVYYAFYDLDNNGVSELFIGAGESETSPDFMKYDMFTLKDGRPYRFFDDSFMEFGYRTSFFIHENGVIECSGFDGANNASGGSYAFFKIADDGYSTVLVDKVAYTGQWPDHLEYYRDLGIPNNREQISEDEFLSVMSELSSGNMWPEETQHDAFTLNWTILDVSSTEYTGNAAADDGDYRQSPPFYSSGDMRREIENNNGNFYPYFTGNSQIGIKDNDGNIIIPPFDYEDRYTSFCDDMLVICKQYDESHSDIQLIDGQEVVIVKSSGIYDIYNMRGSEVKKVAEDLTDYSGISEYNGGLARVSMFDEALNDYRHGFMNENAELAIQPVYHGADSFVGDWANVIIEEDDSVSGSKVSKEFMIDKNGNTVLDLGKYHVAWKYFAEYIVVCERFLTNEFETYPEAEGLMDKYGNFIIPLEYGRIDFEKENNRFVAYNDENRYEYYYFDAPEDRENILTEEDTGDKTDNEDNANIYLPGEDITGTFQYTGTDFKFPEAVTVKSDTSFDVHLDVIDPYTNEDGFIYNDNFFNNPSHIYYHPLGLISLQVAMAAFGIYIEDDRTVWDILATVNSETTDNETTGWEDFGPRTVNITDFLGAKNIENDMGGLGFEDVTPWGFDHKPRKSRSIAATFAHKTIDSSSGETEVILIAVRGGLYDEEWGDNFRVGTSTVHEGFETARYALMDRLGIYLQEHVSPDANVKFWITGYSRGAAVANLVAASLTNAALDFNEYTISDTYKLKLYQNDIYAYCFATPRNNKEPVEYGNIFNIINPTDPVPNFAFVKWGFAAHGKYLWLPDVNDPKYKQEDMLNKLDALGGRFDSGTYVIDKFRYHQGNTSLINLADFGPGLYDAGRHITILNISDYITRPKGLIDMIYETFGSARNFTQQNYERTKQTTAINAAARRDEDNRTLGFMGAVKEIIGLGETINVGIDYNLNDVVATLGLEGSVRYSYRDVMDDLGLEFPYFSSKTAAEAACLEAQRNALAVNQGHFPELYLAWMRTIPLDYWPESPEEYSVYGTRRIVHVNCPVDVQLFDAKTGELYASIVNNVPEIIPGSNFSAETDDEGRKTLYLPNSGEYEVKITATDTGSVSYSVTEFDINSRTETVEAEFPPVDIENGDVLIGRINDIVSGGGGEKYTFGFEDSFWEQMLNFIALPYVWIPAVIVIASTTLIITVLSWKPKQRRR